MIHILKSLFKTTLVCLLVLTCWVGLSTPTQAAPDRESRLPGGNAITEGDAILRYALPIDNDTIFKIQGDIESIIAPIRGRRWGAATSSLSEASFLLSTRNEKILASIAEDRRSEAQEVLEQLSTDLNILREQVAEQDKTAAFETQKSCLFEVETLENLMVQGFPYEVPSEYSALPQLKGRAAVEIETEKGSLTVVVDGYNAPVTAGNFVDLVSRGFYDGLPITRADEFYVLQLGDPPGPENGFVDPATGEERTIPLEIRVQSEVEPIYEFTLEEIGLYREQPVLPFSAYGTLGMARPDNDPNGGSSQFFFFLFEPELTPAGLNLLDGEYAVFGYVVDGEDVLPELKKGDRITSMKVIEGMENFLPG
ncbi:MULTISPECIES: peptidylprolyl isomerase [unclassified Roseofilum]|uniref:peptidylprolyl isomerase n=1 Tax=unclassified Roseofilum TaxID=2620099 RepID=UPI001B09DC01|nr:MULTISPECIES: peptidylprolyl isomerase [unclassified Roseofilum]MBP0007499.1 peptidylprolyl isomerase [Roseofilum sp. Belize Diploria]MBP0031777.1 peptidylprolyl isomerase [Roseofilum sp. Belize BBD 4]